jgi:hypothetical protein
MKKNLTGPMAATFFLLIALNFISFRSSAQSFKGGGIIFTATSGGSGDSSFGGSPKYIIKCDLSLKCTMTQINVFDSTATAAMPKTKIQFVQAHRARKKEEFTMYVFIDSAACPCAK